MFTPQADGCAHPRGRPTALAISRADAFAGLVRTRSTNIIGFVELLIDERLALPPGRRAEYAGIVLAEIAALDGDMRAYLRGTRAAPS